MVQRTSPVFQVDPALRFHREADGAVVMTYTDTLLGDVEERYDASTWARMVANVSVDGATTNFAAVSAAAEGTA